MKLKIGVPIKDQKGFTLVELMVVLSILVLALAAVYQFFFFTHTSYARADARSAIIQETDLFLLQLERDIRSASEPNSNTKSVNILNEGTGIDIYSNKDSQYFRTSYRINGTDLQRGFISTTDANQNNSANPQYGTITNWQPIVSNLMQGDTTIFDDSRNADISSRRLVDINVYVQRPEMENSIHVQTALMSRNGKSTSSIDAYNTNYSYKKVAYIKFYDQNGKEVTSLSMGRDGGNIKFTAKAFAADGTPSTNQNILLKQDVISILWAALPGYSFLSETDLIKIINKLDLKLDGYRDRYVVRSGKSVTLNANTYPWIWHFLFGNTRTATIQAESKEDNIKANLSINQNY